jgi:SAM-dependent methyltransferase
MWLWRIAGLSSFHLDSLINRALGRDEATKGPVRPDRTGRVVRQGEGPTAHHTVSGTVLARYPRQFGHSLWRSQELTLFARYKSRLHKPLADFGCGDGSFASMIFQRVALGIDRDEIALQRAAECRIYDAVLCCDGATLPLRRGTLASVFSNSVLEHCENLDRVLAGIYEVLRPKGIFMFSVPILSFAQDLARLFGETESHRINHRFVHRNLLPAEEWERRLKNVGFSLEQMHFYQPEWFTFLYRVLNTRLARYGARTGLQYSKLGLSSAAKVVERSIGSATDGGNIFVIARR